MLSSAEYFKIVARDEGYNVVHTPQYKAASGSSPNLVHSIDAAHRYMMVMEGQHGTLGGPSMIHQKMKRTCTMFNRGSGGKDTP